MNECISKSDYSATEKNIQTCEDMFTNDDVMSAKQAESHCNLKQVTCSRKGDESQINQIDWFCSKCTLSGLDIEFHLFIGAIKMTIFTHIGR